MDDDLMEIFTLIDRAIDLGWERCEDGDEDQRRQRKQLVLSVFLSAVVTTARRWGIGQDELVGNLRRFWDYAEAATAAAPSIDGEH